LDALAGGAGRVVVLIGEAGTGKTHLLAEMVGDACARGLTVLNCRLSEVGGQEPSVVPDGQIAAPHRLRDVSLPAGRPAVVILEDAHDADDRAVDVVERLVWRAHGQPLLVVIALRPKPASARLRDALARGAEVGVVRRLELDPLSLTEAARLLELPADDERLRRLHRQSRGLPLYLLALAGTGPDGHVPEKYAAQVLGEFARLTDGEQLAANAAAVLQGEDCDLAAIAAVAGLDRSAAEEAVTGLVQRDVLRPVGHIRFAFRHPLLRRLIEEQIDTVWRAAAHRRAARLLDARGAAATRLAFHVERCVAGPEPEDVRLLRRAAEEALPTDPGAAVGWLRAALRNCPEAGDHPCRLDLLILLTRALGVTGHLSESRDLLHEVLPLLPAPGGVRASAVAFFALVESLLGNHAEARAMLECELAAVLALADPPPEAARLIVQDGIIAAIMGRTPPRRRLDDGLRLARVHCDGAAEAGVLALRGLHDAWHDRVGEAGGELTASAGMMDRLTDGDVAVSLEYLAVLAWAEMLVCRYGDAKRHFLRGTAIARKYGLRHALPALLIGLASTHLQIGRPGETRRLASEARAVTEAIGARHARGLAMAVEALGTAWTTPGQDAVRLAEEAMVAFHGERFYWSKAASLALATAARLAGDRCRSSTLIIDAGHGRDLEGLPRAMRPACFEALAEAATDCERPFALTDDPRDAAARWACRAAEAAQVLNLPPQRGHALMTRAHALRLRGEVEPALAAYCAAGELFSSAALARDQALALIAAASCAAAIGHAEDQVAMLNFAVELARRIGATTIEVRARAEFRRLERRAASRELAGLTPREREIAEMAGAGKRTREIADRLSLSPRTVDVHLTRVYRKLNIGSRTALARLLAESDASAASGP
jgi:DNA-binding CsgD family transcriptional regulator/tetratricopeptide (TPR) repeat protein